MGKVVSMVDVKKRLTSMLFSSKSLELHRDSNERTHSSNGKELGIYLIHPCFPSVCVKACEGWGIHVREEHVVCWPDDFLLVERANLEKERGYIGSLLRGLGIFLEIHKNLCGEEGEVGEIFRIWHPISAHLLK